MNFLKFPLIAMFWNMIFYMCHPQMLNWVGAPFYCLPSNHSFGTCRSALAFFTDCGFLGPEPKLDMVQCAAAHEAREKWWCKTYTRHNSLGYLQTIQTCPPTFPCASFIVPLLPQHIEFVVRCKIVMFQTSHTCVTCITNLLSNL